MVSRRFGKYPFQVEDFFKFLKKIGAYCLCHVGMIYFSYHFPFVTERSMIGSYRNRKLTFEYKLKVKLRINLCRFSKIAKRLL